MLLLLLVVVVLVVVRVATGGHKMVVIIRVHGLGRIKVNVGVAAVVGLSMGPRIGHIGLVLWSHGGMVLLGVMVVEVVWLVVVGFIRGDWEAQA